MSDTAKHPTILVACMKKDVTCFLQNAVSTFTCIMIMQYKVFFVLPMFLYIQNQLHYSLDFVLYIDKFVLLFIFPYFINAYCSHKDTNISGLFNNFLFYMIRMQNWSITVWFDMWHSHWLAYRSLVTITRCSRGVRFTKYLKCYR